MTDTAVVQGYTLGGFEFLVAVVVGKSVAVVGPAAVVVAVAVVAGPAAAAVDIAAVASVVVGPAAAVAAAVVAEPAVAIASARDPAVQFVLRELHAQPGHRACSCQLGPLALGRKQEIGFEGEHWAARNRHLRKMVAVLL